MDTSQLRAMAALQGAMAERLLRVADAQDRGNVDSIIELEGEMFKLVNAMAQMSKLDISVPAPSVHDHATDQAQDEVDLAVDSVIEAAVLYKASLLPEEEKATLLSKVKYSGPMAYASKEYFEREIVKAATVLADKVLEFESIIV